MSYSRPLLPSIESFCCYYPCFCLWNLYGSFELTLSTYIRWIFFRILFHRSFYFSQYMLMKYIFLNICIMIFLVLYHRISLLWLYSTWLWWCSYSLILICFPLQLVTFLQKYCQILEISESCCSLIWILFIIGSHFDSWLYWFIFLRIFWLSVLQYYLLTR